MYEKKEKSEKSEKSEVSEIDEKQGSLNQISQEIVSLEELTEVFPHGEDLIKGFYNFVNESAIPIDKKIDKLSKRATLLQINNKKLQINNKKYSNNYEETKKTKDMIKMFNHAEKKLRSYKERLDSESL